MTTTARVVDSLPICRSFGFVMFSVLEPGTHVLPHSGSCNLRLRHHLGIDIPEPDRSQLRVGEEWRSWEQGRCLAFDDSYEHEVQHRGEQRRVILSVDLWHPSLSSEEIEVLSHPVFQSFGKRSLRSLRGS